MVATPEAVKDTQMAATRVVTTQAVPYQVMAVSLMAVNKVAGTPDTLAVDTRVAAMREVATQVVTIPVILGVAITVVVILGVPITVSVILGVPIMVAATAAATMVDMVDIDMAVRDISIKVATVTAIVREDTRECTEATVVVGTTDIPRGGGIGDRRACSAGR